jgi:hypothetical protein
MVEEVGLVDDQDRDAAPFGGFPGQDVPGLDGEGGGAAGGLPAQGRDDAVVDAAVILSFRVIRRCDLRRPVVDNVADETLEA